jgi:hypothetical protein
MEIAYEPEDKEESLKELLKRNNKILQDLMVKSEPSKFKLPFKAKLSKGNIKKDFITVMLIYENGNTEYIKAPIKNGTIDVDGIPRLSTSDYTLYYKGKPMIILPAWSLQPFSPVGNYSDTVRNDMTIAGRRLILERMKLDVLKPKGAGFGAIGWIILIIVLVGAGYYLFKGGKLF